jgi:hypothetical protein
VGDLCRGRPRGRRLYYGPDLLALGLLRQRALRYNRRPPPRGDPYRVLRASRAQG